MRSRVRTYALPARHGSRYNTTGVQPVETSTFDALDGFRSEHPSIPPYPHGSATNAGTFPTFDILTGMRYRSSRTFKYDYAFG